MNIKANWIPKSKKGREIAKLLGKPASKVCGNFLMNIVSAGDLTPNLAAKIAYVLDAESATTEEHDALDRAERARQDPSAVGMTAAEAERYAADQEVGGWALGRR